MQHRICHEFIEVSDGDARIAELTRERDALAARIERVREVFPHLDDAVSEFPCDSKDHEMKVFDSLASVRDAIRAAIGATPAANSAR